MYGREVNTIKCDVQEQFRLLIHNNETVINGTQYMTSVAKALDILSLRHNNIQRYLARQLKTIL